MLKGALFPYPLYTQVNLDSGALMMKCGIAHPLAEAGLYYGRVMRDDQFLAAFAVEVSETTEAVQAQIDLAELHYLGRGLASNEIAKRVQVKAGGYVTLFTSQGEGGYYVTFQNTQGQRTVVWDSRQLTGGDIFSMTPLRPGLYSLHNTVNNSHALTTLVITYPDPRLNQKGQPRPAPVYTTCRQEGFAVNSFELRPAQGIVFAFESAARIVLTLTEPDDGSSDLRRWHEEQRAQLIRKAKAFSRL